MKRRKIYFITITFLIIGVNAFSQSTPIPQTNYTVQSFSSDNTNHPVAHAFDNDTTTWWALYNSAGYSLPGIVELNLGASYDVNGFSYLPNPANSNDKAIGYEIYLSVDGVTWGTPEVIGDFAWVSTSDVSRQDIYFGAITAQYVKVVYTSNQNTSNDNVHTGDLVIYESTTAATGQINQTMTFSSVPDKYSTDNPFILSGTTSSGLPITYSVVSGPATIVDSTVTLTGTGGIVELKAEQLGDATYYPASLSQTFEVFDLSSYSPIITTRLTENYPVEMPSLMAYPIYLNSSIDHPDSLSVDSMTVEVGGQTYLAEMHNSGYYYVLWTPTTYGAHTVNITSYASNGNTTNLSKNITVSNTIANQNVSTLNGVDITFGGTNSRWYYGTYEMPQHVGAYDNITANLTIGCPPTSNACDDWDRLAYIDVKAPDGNWIQIIRYITPYGVACNHNIDLTDYASLLQGEFEFRMFIDTWGTGGWLVTLDFDHQAGAPIYNYSMVDEIWDGSYDLGNPSNLQPVDTVAYTFPINVQDAKLRVSNTGHGWGNNNSQNAAEFYHAYNYIHINSVNTFTQNLWNTCNPNPDNCTGQQGTWTYSRAGWCPGAISPPNEYSLSSYISSGIDLAYEFDPTYTDFCHPNNPGCISGSTCPDCNDGYKAWYSVDAHVVSFSNLPLLYDPLFTGYVDNVLNYELNIYPNPSTDFFKLNVKNIKGTSKVVINTIEGKGIKTYYFNSKEDIDKHVFDISELSDGAYFISIENEAGMGVKKLIIQ
jgi:hypothetical protein